MTSFVHGFVAGLEPARLPRLSKPGSATPALGADQALGHSAQSPDEVCTARSTPWQARFNSPMTLVLLSRAEPSMRGSTCRRARSRRRA